MDWDKSEKLFWRIYGAMILLTALPTLYFYDLKELGFYLVGALALGAELKLIVVVVKFLVGTLKGNFLAILGIFVAKVGLWIGLASAPFWLPKGMGLPFAIGCSTFATTLLIFLLRTGGAPKLERS